MQFVNIFWLMLSLMWPLWLSLISAISLIGLAVGRIEKLSPVDSLYFAFVTATTVGYGDFTPKHRRTKLAAIMIALMGILLTGIIVAAGVKAVEYSMKDHYTFEQFSTLLKNNLGN